MDQLAVFTISSQLATCKTGATRNSRLAIATRTLPIHFLTGHDKVCVYINPILMIAQSQTLRSNLWSIS